MVCTVFILLVYLLLILLGSQWKNVDDTEHFMNREYTNVLKGLCCILVVIVHVPSAYNNPLQQAVGGFSQVSVTFYFLFSAYGILESIKSKPDYLLHFWRNRLPSLLIPFALSSMVKMLMGVEPGSGGTYFVFVLLLFYVITYIAAKYYSNRMICIVCVAVSIYSIMGSITGWLHWPTQALGFCYGALLTQYLPMFSHWMKRRYWFKLSAITVFAAFFTFIYAVIEPAISEFASVILQNIMVLFLILWVFMITFRLKLGNFASKYLGSISYDIFLYHGLVQVLMKSLDENSVRVNLSSGVFLLLMMLFSILLSAATHVVNSYILQYLKKKYTPSKC